MAWTFRSIKPSVDNDESAASAALFFRGKPQSGYLKNSRIPFVMMVSRRGGVVIMFGVGFRAVSLALGGLGLALSPVQVLAQEWFNPFAPPTYNPTTMVFGGLTATPTSAFGYIGGAYGLKSDLWSDGYRIRVLAGAGTY
ncbi:MAG TPA: hypothetical protein VLA28_11235, partial [Afifellaceae bacterium]|nr:hypothetical protein [Afifellaceae bacterium]